METLRVAFPPSPPVERAFQKMRAATHRLKRNPPRSIAELQLTRISCGPSLFRRVAVFSAKPEGNRTASHSRRLDSDPATEIAQKARHQSAPVYDLMEPYRPIVDRKLLAFVRATTFTPADFTITSKRVCLLNPQLARNIVRLVDI
jgi:CRISPR associated protein, Cas1 family